MSVLGEGLGHLRLNRDRRSQRYALGSGPWHHTRCKSASRMKAREESLRCALASERPRSTEVSFRRDANYEPIRESPDAGESVIRVLLFRGLRPVERESTSHANE